MIRNRFAKPSYNYDISAFSNQEREAFYESSEGSGFVDYNSMVRNQIEMAYEADADPLRDAEPEIEPVDAAGEPAIDGVPRIRRPGGYNPVPVEEGSGDVAIDIVEDGAADLAEGAVEDALIMGAGEVFGVVATAGLAIANEWTGANANRSTEEKAVRSTLDLELIVAGGLIGSILLGPVGALIGASIAEFASKYVFDYISGDHAKRVALEKTEMDQCLRIYRRDMDEAAKCRAKFETIRKAVIDSGFTKWKDADLKRLPRELPVLTHSLKSAPSEYDIYYDLETAIYTANYAQEILGLAEADLTDITAVALEIDDAVSRVWRKAMYSDSPINPKTGVVRWQYGRYKSYEASTSEYAAIFKPPQKFNFYAPEVNKQIDAEIGSFLLWKGGKVLSEVYRDKAEREERERETNHPNDTSNKPGQSNNDPSKNVDDYESDGGSDAVENERDMAEWLQDNNDASLMNKEDSTISYLEERIVGGYFDKHPGGDTHFHLREHELYYNYAGLEVQSYRKYQEYQAELVLQSQRGNA